MRIRAYKRTEPNDENDPILRKYHYMDPGLINYKRTAFESLFYKIPQPLSGKELKNMVRGKKLKLLLEDTAIVLQIHKAPWKDANDLLWDSIAQLLNEWSVEITLRDALPLILDSANNLEDIGYISIPLKVTYDPNSIDDNTIGI